MLRIAITGNIGTGKSTVCKVFESLGINVYYADKEARKFYRNKDVITAVKQLFGEEVFDKDDILNASALASLVFGNPEKLQQLNAIIHPLVLDGFLQWADQQSEAKYILYESALLFESGFYKHFDKNILVTAPASLAKSRVLSRDGLSEEEFDARKSRQIPQNELIKKADLILENDEKSPLIPRILEIHQGLNSL